MQSIRNERGRLFLVASVLIAALTAAVAVGGQGAVPSALSHTALGAAAVESMNTGTVPVRISIEPATVIAGFGTYVRVYLNDAAAAGGQAVQMSYMTTEDDADLLATYTQEITVDATRYVDRFLLSTQSRVTGGYISVVARINDDSVSAVLKVDGSPP